jgi:hypothetical protein
MVMHPDAEDLVRRLELSTHPEGGFYRETWRSPLSLGAHGAVRAASTAIYFLLPAGQFSALHRVASVRISRDRERADRTIVNAKIGAS